MSCCHGRFLPLNVFAGNLGLDIVPVFGFFKILVLYALVLTVIFGVVIFVIVVDIVDITIGIADVRIGRILTVPVRSLGGSVAGLTVTGRSARIGSTRIRSSGTGSAGIRTGRNLAGPVRSLSGSAARLTVTGRSARIGSTGTGSAAGGIAGRLRRRGRIGRLLRRRSGIAGGGTAFVRLSGRLFRLAGGFFLLSGIRGSGTLGLGALAASAARLFLLRFGTLAGGSGIVRADGRSACALGRVIALSQYIHRHELDNHEHGHQ